MTLQSLDGLWWFLLALGPLYLLRRALHRETQGVFLLLTRRGDVTVLLFSLLLFPGVLLHEVSHYLAARLLGVRTGRFSLLPRDLGDGRLQLGFVEVYKADLLRDALIGAAPLVSGGLFVAYAGRAQLGLLALWEPLMAGELQAVLGALAALPERPDFWLWLYLTVAVSSTMLPSASDRRSWWPLGLALFGLLAAALLAGAGAWMLANLGPALNGGLRALALVFGVGVAVHLALLPPVWALRQLLSRITGLEVV